MNTAAESHAPKWRVQIGSTKYVVSAADAEEAKDVAAQRWLDDVQSGKVVAGYAACILPPVAV